MLVLSLHPFTQLQYPVIKHVIYYRSLQSLRDWQHVFIVTGCAHLAGVVFYGIFASGSLQPWASEIQQLITASNYSAISASENEDNTRSKEKTEAE